jgi:hypothetical protein
VRKLKFGDLSVINKAITTDNQTTLMDALGATLPLLFWPTVRQGVFMEATEIGLVQKSKRASSEAGLGARHRLVPSL